MIEIKFACSGKVPWSHKILHCSFERAIVKPDVFRKEYHPARFEQLVQHFQNGFRFWNFAENLYVEQWDV